MNTKGQINVYILTGFLGSGKTTILNNILQQVSTSKNIIVENEFGKINIDKQLIEQKYDQLYELINGCICCTHDEGFFDLLTELYQKKDEIDNLFIETTGVADVSPIIATFQREDIKKTFKLINTICIVDAEVIEDYLEQFGEVERQIVAADILIVNKAKMVADTYLTELHDLLSHKNPFASIIDTADGAVALDAIQKQSNDIVINKELPTRKDFKHSPLKTILYETTELVDYLKFQHIITVTMLLYSNQIYRSKGFFKASSGKVYLHQSAGKGVTITEAKDKDIDKTQIVFIGKNVEVKSIERIMQQTLYKQA